MKDDKYFMWIWIVAVVEVLAFIALACYVGR